MNDVSAWLLRVNAGMEHRLFDDVGWLPRRLRSPLFFNRGPKP